MVDNSLNFNIDLGQASQPAQMAGAPSDIEQQQPKVAGGAAQAEQDSGASNLPSFLKKSANPTMCVLHFAFKVVAMLLYFILTLALDDGTIAFIIVSTFSVIDFWIAKNLTGRILVGLRWWSQIKADGEEEWVYESLKDDSRVNGVDKAVFWGVSYLTPILWLVFAILQILTFSLNNFFMCMVAFTLSFVNLLNYIRCQKNHNNMIRGFMFRKAKENLSGEQMQQIGGMVAKETLKQQFK